MNLSVARSDTYEARLIGELIDTYNIEAILAGKREEVLTAILDGAETAADLETEGFAQSTVYQSLKQLRATGILEETGDGYRISDETLRTFLKTRISTNGNEYTADGDTIRRTTAEDFEAQKTAFSRFSRYGVEYYPADTYYYQGDSDLELEDVLIHAVRFADTTKQTAMCAVFHLTHSSSLDQSELWRLARHWDCVEKWADLLAFLDQRPVTQEDLFLPGDEFTELARDYDVSLRSKHPEDSLLTGLEKLGDQLETSVDAYLLGGGNLILRGLKDSTKDLDVVVETRDIFIELVETLQELGYEERRDLSEVYEQLDPSIVLEKQGFPRWDIFVGTVADSLKLTQDMQQRVDQTRRFGNLKLRLLSLTDIFVFKSITDREGDLEDNALIAQQGEIDWPKILDEIQTQEELTEQYFSAS